MASHEEWGRKDVDPNPFDKLFTDKIDLVINTIGATKNCDLEHTRLVEYEVNRLLIESAKKHFVKKYIMISNLLAGITDGYLPMFVNAKGGGVLDYKLKAENVLR